MKTSRNSPLRHALAVPPSSRCSFSASCFYVCPNSGHQQVPSNESTALSPFLLSFSPVCFLFLQSCCRDGVECPSQIVCIKLKAITQCSSFSVKCNCWVAHRVVAAAELKTRCGPNIGCCRERIWLGTAAAVLCGVAARCCCGEWLWLGLLLVAAVDNIRQLLIVTFSVALKLPI